jgi:hypothetical protein
VTGRLLSAAGPSRYVVCQLTTTRGCPIANVRHGYPIANARRSHCSPNASDRRHRSCPIANGRRGYPIANVRPTAPASRDQSQLQGRR